MSRLGVRTSDWYIVDGGDGFQSRNDPEDPNIVYASSQNGGISRLDLRTGHQPIDSAAGHAGIRRRRWRRRDAGRAAAGSRRRGAGAAGCRGARPGAGAGAPGTAAAPQVSRRKVPGRRASGRPRWAGPRQRRSRQLGRAVHHQPALAAAPLLGDELRLSHRRSRRQLDAHQPRSLAQPQSRRDPDHGQALAGRLDRAQHVDDAAQQHRLDRRVTAARRPALRRHRRWARAGDARTAGRTGARSSSSPACRSGPTSPTSSPRRATPTRSSPRSTTGSAATTSPTSSRARTAAGRGPTSAATCRRSTTCGRSSRITSTATCCSRAPSSACSRASTADSTGCQLKGGMPPAQVRDMTVQKRENDLVLATFGRGFYILDDYSALRDITPATLAEDARLFPLRDAVSLQPARARACGQRGTLAAVGLVARREPAVWRRVHVSRAAGTARRREAGADDQRRCRDARFAGWTSRRAPGLRRVAWNLRTDPPAAARAGLARAAAAAGRGGQAGRGGFGGGRGGNLPPLVQPGRYRATLGRMVGDVVTPIGVAADRSASCRYRSRDGALNLTVGR